MLGSYLSAKLIFTAKLTRNLRAFYTKGKSDINKCGLSLPTSEQRGHDFNLSGLVRYQGRGRQVMKGF